MITPKKQWVGWVTLPNVSLPEFIEGEAKGQMRMIHGKPCKRIEMDWANVQYKQRLGAPGGYESSYYWEGGQVMLSYFEDK